jgi:outer membrane beta-barrel protein
VRAAALALLLVPAAALAEESPPPPAPAAEAPRPPDPDDQREREADDERTSAPRRRVDLDLDSRIRPVSGALFVKDGRHELGPVLGISLSDAFFTKYLAGVRYAYHLSEAFSVGASASFAASSASGAVARCDAQGEGCRTPSKDDLRHTPGDFGAVAGLDVSWAPLYGKISVLAASVLHFDTYLLAGAGMLQTRIAPPGRDAVEETWRPEGHVALGQRYTLGPWGTIRIELRDMLYGIEVQGRQGPADRLENQLMFNVGLSFFLGEGRAP